MMDTNMMIAMPISMALDLDFSPGVATRRFPDAKHKPMISNTIKGKCHKYLYGSFSFGWSVNW